MNDLERASPVYGRERLCPHCGARVAQRAEVCFYCNGSLSAAPRTRRAIPWADLILFAFIVVLLALWWLRTPGGPEAAQAGQTAVGAATRPTPTRRPTATATAPSPAPTATPAPTPIMHKIAAGESLALIAEKYGLTAKEIAEANAMTVNDMIYPGQELTIPPPRPGGAPLPTPTPTGGTLLYTVQAGDTLSEIAERFDSQLDWILQANKRRLDDMLRPGDRLLIPLSNRTPTPTLSPTPTVTPTPSATSDIVLRPPLPLAPADNATVVGEVLLRWASSAVLSKNQWYVVTLQGPDEETPIAPYWTKGTQWRLPAEYHSGGGEALRFAWQVQVFTAAADREDARPASPPSETRVFTWTR